jgi:nucleotide-binding universal stress UspA family protein
MKILVGFDGSYLSKEAVKTAVKHEQEINADIEVVTVRSRSGEFPYKNIVGLEKKLA